MTQHNQGGFFGDGKNFFYVSPEGSTHIITRAYIIANGIRDLCIVKGAKPGDVCCRKIGKAKKDEILLIPLGDILWINIDPPYTGNVHSIVLDIGSNEQDMKPLVRALLEYGDVSKSTKGDQYDMYGGDNYLEEG
jgi:hypothetical protein